MSRNQEVARIIWETWVRETDGSPIPWEDAPLYAPEDARCVQACAEAITAWNTRAPSALPVGWNDLARDIGGVANLLEHRMTTEGNMERENTRLAVETLRRAQVMLSASPPEPGVK
jgi:hypothetical protein